MSKSITTFVFIIITVLCAFAFYMHVRALAAWADTMIITSQLSQNEITSKTRYLGPAPEDVVFEKAKLWNAETERFEKTIIQLATWYDYELPGFPEYSKEHDTCASREYTRGTILRVWRVDTNKSVLCRVNDWIEEPSVDIDLSSHAFKQLAPLSRGKIEVVIQPVK